jgi:SAM-dependent methyltransferase
MATLAPAPLPSSPDAPRLPALPRHGLRRSLALAKVFRLEQSDPDTFYRSVAEDTVAQIGQYTTLVGTTVIDVGGGAGYFTEALRGAGARCTLVEPEAGEAPLSPPGPGSPPADRHRYAVSAGRVAVGVTVAGDGYHLPVPDGLADLTFSSNVLEHVPDVSSFLDELVRVTRPDGLVYVSFTAWYSFWGGHETAPWHYLGGHRAARRYETKTGHPPKNRFGSSLFACHVGPTLRLVRRRPDVDVIAAIPRYHPRWLHWVVAVPVLRELVTWNLLLVLRRRPEATA